MKTDKPSGQTAPPLRESGGRHVHSILVKSAAAVLILLLVIAVFSGAGAAGKYTDLHGKCGDNLEWRFEKNPEDPDFDILHIYGTGPMWNAIHESGGRTHWDIYEWYGYRDWYVYDHPTCFSKVVIDSGVTSIGNNVFSDCNNIKTISIPNTVTSIGNNIFTDCKNLESVTLPNSVTSIGNNVFTDCKNLESVTLPNSVTSIGSEVFWGCTNLKSVTIPNGITSISEEMFMSSGIESVTLPESLKSIGNCAFARCANLESIVIPEKVTSIDRYAFFWCTNLKEIWIKGDITSIDGTVFYKVADGCTVHCTQKTAEILRSKYGSALNIIITGGSSPQSPGSGAEPGSLEMTGVNWMSFLPDSASIGQINLPGAHDAPAFNTQAQASLPISDMPIPIPIPIGGLFKCHDMDVTEQFESGARWFDFRFIYTESCSEPFYEGTAHDYLTVHGEAHCNTSDDQPYLFFKNGVKELSDELSEFNTEFAVITYQFESDFTGVFSIYSSDLEKTAALNQLRGDIATLCANHRDKYLHIKNGDTLPTLGEARGKIIFIESGEYNKTEDHYNTTFEEKTGYLKALWDKAALQNYTDSYPLSNSPSSPSPVVAFASFTEPHIIDYIRVMDGQGNIIPIEINYPCSLQSSAATQWVANDGYPFTKGNYYGVTLFNSVGINLRTFADACEKVYKSNAETCQLHISDPPSERKSPVSYDVEIRLGAKSLEMPVIDGYTIEGLFTSPSCDIKAADEHGCLIPGVSGYTNADGEWIKISLEPVPLYIKRTVNETTVTADDSGTATFGGNSKTAVRDEGKVTHILLDSVSGVTEAVTFIADCVVDESGIPAQTGMKRTVVSVFDIAASPAPGTEASFKLTIELNNINDKYNVVFWHCKDGVWEKLSSSIDTEENLKITYRVETDSFSPFAVTIESAIPQSSHSSKSQGTSIWLTAEPTATPAAPATEPAAEPAPTATSTPEAPSVKPIEQTQTATQTGASPAPVMGVLAALGAGLAAVFGLRRK